MALQRMDIQSVVVGSGPVTSLVILRVHHEDSTDVVQLPIRIGRVEAAAIGMGVDGRASTRPMTHDLMKGIIDSLGATLEDVVIHNVKGTTFFACVRLKGPAGEQVTVDARPSDAIALAIRMKKPIYADDQVIEMAAMPDFASVERSEREREAEEFHNFVEGLSPEDFEG